MLQGPDPEGGRWHWEGGILNPASMKQALVEGAVPIQGIPMYEQGQGKINLLRSMVRPVPQHRGPALLHISQAGMLGHASVV